MNNGPLPPPASPVSAPADLDAPKPSQELMPDPSERGLTDRGVRALEELERMISTPPTTPEIGRRASEAMRIAFETVSNDVEAIAQENVDRALAMRHEAGAYATALRNAGTVLCRRIESEALRANHISLIMRETMRRLGVIEAEGSTTEG